MKDSIVYFFDLTFLLYPKRNLRFRSFLLLQNFSVFWESKFPTHQTPSKKVYFKGILKRTKPYKLDIRLVWRIRESSLKECRLWHLIVTLTLTQSWLSAIISLYKYTQQHSSEGCLFLSEKTSHIILEANKKQFPLKSYSLKITIDFLNQILKNKQS